MSAWLTAVKNQAGLLAFYRMATLSGTLELDQSGQGKDATIVGSVLLNQPGVPADGNPSMFFDATGGKLTTPVNLNGLTACSVEAWFLLSTAGVASQDNTILGEATSNGFSFRVRAGGSNVAEWAIAGFTDGTQAIRSAPLGFTPDTVGRHHLLGTWSAASGFALYVDGVSAKTGGTNIASISGLGLIQIGIRPATGVASAFGGYLDEIAIYSTQLQPADALAHFNAGWNAPPQLSAPAYQNYG